jgi:hypothetical protein
MTEQKILSSAQVETFARDGYLVVRGLYGPDEVAELSTWTDEVAGYPELPGKYMMYFEESLTEPGKRLICRIENFCPYHRGFAALLEGERMRGCVSDLFGEPAVLFKDKINFKLPGGNGFTPHQDVQAGWDTYARLHITAMVSIDACTLENGCLELAAGHQRRGLIGSSWAPLAGEQLQGVEFVPCTTEPGDAVFFDSYAPHRSGPNMSRDPRRVLYVTYNRLSEGDHRAQYYADKRKSYPPDCEREAGRQYVFRV